MLGGKCVICAGTDKLCVTRKDPENDGIDYDSIVLIAKSRWADELAKHEVKCKVCLNRISAKKAKHTKESWTEHGGGVAGRTGCKCQLCFEKRKKYMAKWYRDMIIQKEIVAIWGMRGIKPKPSKS